MSEALPVPGRLAVVDEPHRVLVVREDDASDWLCAFDKADGFPARRWAQDMARTYNARLELSCASSRRPPAASGP
jgi:hypothetical protein